VKVLVDTSAWADFLNGHPTAEREALRELITGEDDLFTCGLVVAEVFQGLRKEKGREELTDLFRQLNYLEPDGIELYFRAAALYRDLRAQGVTIRSTIDCLIAILAETSGCHLLARDRDLAQILKSGLVSVRPWPVATASPPETA
jgi:hypothetical protein